MSSISALNTATSAASSSFLYPSSNSINNAFNYDDFSFPEYNVKTEPRSSSLNSCLSGFFPSLGLSSRILTPTANQITQQTIQFYGNTPSGPIQVYRTASNTIIFNSNGPNNPAATSSSMFPFLASGNIKTESAVEAIPGLSSYSSASSEEFLGPEHAENSTTSTVIVPNSLNSTNLFDFPGNFLPLPELNGLDFTGSSRNVSVQSISIHNLLFSTNNPAITGKKRERDWETEEVDRSTANISNPTAMYVPEEQKLTNLLLASEHNVEYPSIDRFHSSPLNSAPLLLPVPLIHSASGPLITGKTSENHRNCCCQGHNCHNLANMAQFNAVAAQVTTQNTLSISAAHMSPVTSAKKAQIISVSSGQNKKQRRDSVSSAVSNVSNHSRTDSSAEKSVNSTEKQLSARSNSSSARFCPVCSVECEHDKAKFVHCAQAHSIYVCIACSAQFGSVSALEEHKLLHNAQNFAFICELCGKAFNKKYNCEQHTAIHTNTKPYSCPICAKQFTQKSYLKLHERIHAKLKPFSCSFCGRGFTLKSDVKKHERIHTKEKPYSCEQCGKAFNHSSNYNRHIKLFKGDCVNKISKKTSSNSSVNNETETTQMELSQADEIDEFAIATDEEYINLPAN
jgi:uncharacterized Zn-finger protein